MKTTAAITLREESLQTEEEKKDRVSFSVAIDPADPDDRTKMYATKFAAGSAKDWLEFIKEARSIIEAKNWTTNAGAQYRMYSLLLKDDAKTKFMSLVPQAGVTIASIDTGLLTMTKEDYLPTDCAKNTLQYLNQVTKTKDLTVAEFLNRIKTLNSYLPLMPPPMNVALTHAQLIALIERSVPGTWYRQFQLQQTLGGSQPTLSTMIQYFKVCEIQDLPSHAADTRKHQKGHGGGDNDSGDSTRSTKRSGRNQGGHRGGTAGRSQSQAAGAGSTTTRRSERTRGPYCPVHKTSSHSWA